MVKIVKKLGVLLSATIGLAGLTGLIGCATTSTMYRDAKSPEVYILAHPVSSKGISEEKREMQEKEIQRQEDELETYLRDYQPFAEKRFYNEPGLRDKEHAMPIANIRF